MVSRRGYEQLPDEDKYPIAPEHRAPVRKPHREVVVGIVLLLLGFALIACGILIHLEHLENKVPGAKQSVAAHCLAV